MESLSAILQRMTTPDETTKPDSKMCDWQPECSAMIEPRWALPGHWVVDRFCPEHDIRNTEAQFERAESERLDRMAHAEQLAIDKAVRSVAQSERTRSMTFANYDPQNNSQLIALEAVKGSAWLHGRPGCGKTHLATAAALDLITSSSEYVGDWGDGEKFRTASVHRWLVADLMALVRSQAMESGMEETIAELSECDLLILDDLGVERPTPLSLETLYRIVDARYENDRRTIVTSNAAPSVVAKVIGARIHSRLIGMCQVVHVDGDDWRLR